MSARVGVPDHHEHAPERSGTLSGGGKTAAAGLEAT